MTPGSSASSLLQIGCRGGGNRIAQKPITLEDCYMRTTKYSLMQINESIEAAREMRTWSAGA
jgi:hypothetical protein